MGPLMMGIARLVPWEILDRIGLWRIPKWLYDHNVWPLARLKAHDLASDSFIPPNKK